MERGRACLVLSSSIALASTRAPLISSIATATGRRNRRGPALPGFTYSTPSRRSIHGRCEWPATTTSTLSAAGSRSSCARSWITSSRTSATFTRAMLGSPAAHASRSLLPRTATTGATIASASRMPGWPTSPACTMRSLPCRAATASGRNSPCVSEMSPMRARRCIATARRPLSGTSGCGAPDAVPEPAVEQRIPDQHERGQQPLELSRQSFRIDDGEQVVLDEAAGVACIARANAQRVLEWGQRARAAGRLDEHRPRQRGHVQPRHPSPSEREEGAQRDERDEQEMDGEHRVGRESFEHALTLYRCRYAE